jgi:hypothetical protein
LDQKETRKRASTPISERFLRSQVSAIISDAAPFGLEWENVARILVICVVGAELLVEHAIQKHIN